MSGVDLSLLALSLGCASLFAGFASLRRHRQIQNLPTSRTRSMAAGPVELIGQVHSEPSLVSPLTARPCAWWSYSIDEYRGGKHPWREIERGDSNACPLRLVDATGEACVDLSGIDVTPSRTTLRAVRRAGRRVASFLAARGVRSSRRLRIRESRIDAGDSILLHGVARVGVHVEPSRLRVARLRAAAQRIAALPAALGGAANPRALRPALARRLRALKRERLAAGTPLDERDLAALRQRARGEVEAERAETRAALGRLEFLARHSLDPDPLKLDAAESLLAALLLRLPDLPESGPVVGDDPLGQARCFLLPGDESRALRATRYGLAAVAGGIGLIAAALIGFALSF